MSECVVIRRRENGAMKYVHLRWESREPGGVFLEWTDCLDLATVFPTEHEARATLGRYLGGREFLGNAEIMLWKGGDYER